MFWNKEKMNKNKIFEHFKNLSMKNSQHMKVVEFSEDAIVFTVNVNNSEHHILISVFQNNPVEIVELAIVTGTFLPKNGDIFYDLLERNNVLIHVKYALRENTIALLVRCTMDEISHQFLGGAIMQLTSEADYSRGLLGFQ